MFALGIVITVLYEGFNLINIHPLIYNVLLRALGPGLVLGLTFLPVKMIVINTSKKTMVTERHLLWFRITLNKKPLPNVDYISTFRQLQSEGRLTTTSTYNVYSYIYNINLWHGNRHIKLCSQYTAEEALKMAEELANALKCGLLDATADEKVWLIPEKVIN